MKLVSSILLSISCLFSAMTSHADTLRVAVASNFVHALRLLSDDFTRQSGHELRISSASTGKLYMQIQHGAPFDIFMSADEKRPELLVAEGRAEASSAYVYAIGRLVFVSNIVPPESCQVILRSTALERLSIANPETAPYGVASRQVLEKLGLWSELEPKIVFGENVAQALQFVATKNAQAGFIARSVFNLALLQERKEVDDVCFWDVPADMHSPIKQKMVVMNQAKGIAAVQAFSQYIRSEHAKKIIKAAGYDVL